jgi:hypothetical protein
VFDSYFSARYILSKKALMNLVLSDRSDGKSFDVKFEALEDYEHSKDISILMRRYKTEITSKMYENFFNEVIAVPKGERFSKWQFKGSKVGVQVRKSEEDEWDWIVYFVPLSTSSRLKSQIADVSRIHKIYFDEYVPLDNRYLPDEMHLLLEFYKSIDRDRDNTQLICLGNKVTAFNPFLDFFGFDLSITNDKIRMYKNNTIAVQIYANKEHRQVRAKSKFADMISDTDYEDYSKGGILESTNIKIASHIGMQYFASFRSCKGEGSIWTNGNMFCIACTKRKDGFVLVDQMYNTTREMYSINFERFGQLFRRVCSTGRLCCEDEKAFHLFEPLLQKVWH